MDNISIRILDKNFNLLGEIDDYESLIFVRRFFKTGEFELHINLNKQNTEKLVEDNLILLGNYMNKVGILEHIQKEMNLDGKEQLIIKGSTLQGLLKRRITVPVGDFDRATGKQESIIKQFVNNNIINPKDFNRKINNLIIAKDKKRGKEDNWRTRYDNLAEKISKIAEYSELGWNIYIDTEKEKMIFDVTEGKDLTSNQDILPPVIFSIDFDNIYDKQFIKNLMNYKNIAYTGGKGEGSERLIQEIGIGQGLSRREIFIDSSNSDSVKELKKSGKHKLDEFKIVETFEAKINPFEPFKYQKDWDLGDTVTVLDKDWNITLNTRITEIREIYEVNGFSLECTFGNSFPTILDKIKKKGEIK